MNRRNSTWGGIVVGESSPVTKKPVNRRDTAHKNAKYLKRNQTPAEIKLNEILNELNGGVLKGRFVCQWVFADKWILDFFFYENRLGIEVDGSIHKETEHSVRDTQKEKACKEWGITLIRIRNNEVFGERDYLVNLLRKAWRQANQNIMNSPFALKDNVKNDISNTGAKDNGWVLKCISCGQPIDSKRLSRIPNALWCTQCSQIKASPATSGRASDLKCPRCAKQGIMSYLVYRTNRDPSKHSEYFLGCSRFPKCRYVDR